MTPPPIRLPWVAHRVIRPAAFESPLRQQDNASGYKKERPPVPVPDTDAGVAEAADTKQKEQTMPITMRSSGPRIELPRERLATARCCSRYIFHWLRERSRCART